jgi:ABC-type Fe3+ transport system substrate-binding protein
MFSPVIKRWCVRGCILLVIASLAAALYLLERNVDTGQTSGIEYPPGETAGTLNIISPHWEGIRIEFMRGFNEWRIASGKKPVNIDWLDVGGTSDIVKFIRSAFLATPEGIGIDIFFGGGTDPYVSFAEEGLLAPCEVSQGIMSNIPPLLHGLMLYDTNGYWFGAAMSGFGILYNKVVCERFNLPIPKTWQDLTKPELRTWIGSADPSKSGSSHMMYEIILQAYGWDRGMDIIGALAGNVRSFTASASTVPKDIAVGEIAAGLCIDVYAWSTIREIGEDRLGFVLPKGLTVVNGDAIAMLKGAPEPGLAREFIEFVLSENGQKIWMLKKNSLPGAPTEFELNKMPVWPSLYARYKDYCIFPDSPFTWKSSVQYDFSKGSTRWGIVNDYIGKLFIEAHPECASAWKRVCSDPASNVLYRIYMDDPCTEEEIMNLAVNEFKDSGKRAGILTEWANDARRRYKEIIKFR